ncbi:uncharacterized protein FA14DRAFT_190790 [Meira miltonrushii]|uniref:TPR-like protein n=1 Tax=Meira miltonrushii TaxID=1280837 RepID=A0A316V831_9BASI|nr:uncharacterized protein FA14DRAFT_190790 [Meira miltonrushii]PWN33660.1 hypothetical protein FA14DRAFT_190790 [Meira miltonrushii]
MSKKVKKTTSFRSLQHTITRDIQDIRDITVLYDKATLLYERGDHRGAYVYFDICVTARKDEPQYRLSRGICAFSLHVYKQAYEDAKISMKMKERVERHSTSRELQKQISDKLLSSLMADHRKHISRCKYWMGKANFEQGDYENALSEFNESQLIMPNSKAREMKKQCEERKKQGLGSMYYHTASSRCKRLFCDEENMTSQHQHSNRHPIKYAPAFSSTLQHPQDSQLPHSILGTYAVFDRHSFYEEKARLIQKAIGAQSKDSELRSMAASNEQGDDDLDSDDI